MRCGSTRVQRMAAAAVPPPCADGWPPRAVMRRQPFRNRRTRARRNSGWWAGGASEAALSTGDPGCDMPRWPLRIRSAINFFCTAQRVEFGAFDIHFQERGREVRRRFVERHALDDRVRLAGTACGAFPAWKRSDFVRSERPSGQHIMAPPSERGLQRFEVGLIRFETEALLDLYATFCVKPRSVAVVGAGIDHERVATTAAGSRAHIAALRARPAATSLSMPRAEPPEDAGAGFVGEAFQYSAGLPSACVILLPPKWSVQPEGSRPAPAGVGGRSPQPLRSHVSNPLLCSRDTSVARSATEPLCMPSATAAERVTGVRRETGTAVPPHRRPGSADCDRRRPERACRHR